MHASSVLLRFPVALDDCKKRFREIVTELSKSSSITASEDEKQEKAEELSQETQADRPSTPTPPAKRSRRSLRASAPPLLHTEGSFFLQFVDQSLV